MKLVFRCAERALEPGFKPTSQEAGTYEKTCVYLG